MNNIPEQHSLRDSVLERIERDALKPRPVWHFLLHEWSIRISAVLALALGSLATALTIYLVDVHRYTEQNTTSSLWSAVFEALPWVWLVILCVALFYSVHAFRETRRGYRYNSKWLVLGALTMSVFFGSALYAMGLGAKVDSYLLAEAPFYQPLTGFHHGRWMNLQSGVLAGTVLETGEETFTLQAVSGDIIVVRILNTTVARPFGILIPGAEVRVVGTTSTEVMNDTGYPLFDAFEIRPFSGRGGRMQERAPMYGRGIMYQMKEYKVEMRTNE